MHLTEEDLKESRGQRSVCRLQAMREPEIKGRMRGGGGGGGGGRTAGRTAERVRRRSETGGSPTTTANTLAPCRTCLLYVCVCAWLPFHFAS